MMAYEINADLWYYCSLEMDQTLFAATVLLAEEHSLKQRYEN